MVAVNELTLETALELELEQRREIQRHLREQPHLRTISISFV